MDAEICVQCYIQEGVERGVVIISWRWGSYQGKGMLILASACLDWRDGKPLLLLCWLLRRPYQVSAAEMENGNECGSGYPP